MWPASLTSRRARIERQALKLTPFGGATFAGFWMITADD